MTRGLKKKLTRGRGGSGKVVEIKAFKRLFLLMIVKYSFTKLTNVLLALLYFKHR